MPRPRGRYVPALDGLRGIAILLVLCVHFTVPSDVGGTIARLVRGAAGLGWVGVDLFFVLSGFLITGLLIEARGSPTYFRAFWARRALRILPPYYLLLLVLVVGGAWLPGMSEGELATLRRYQGWFWTYLQNVPALWVTPWDLTPWTGHLWSLAIEEQFYLLWPFAVWATPPARLARVCAAVAVGAVVVRIALVALGAPPPAPYVLMPARMDALALGALCAAIASRRPGGLAGYERAGRFVAYGGTTVFLLAYLAEPGAFAVFVYAGTAIAFTGVLVTVLATPDGAWLRRALEWGPLRAAGRYSYAAYLAHLPVRMVLWRGGVGTGADERIGPQVALFVAGVSLTFGVAWLSWRVFEQPILRLKRYAPYWPDRTGASLSSREPSIGAPPGPARPATGADP